MESEEPKIESKEASERVGLYFKIGLIGTVLIIQLTHKFISGNHRGNSFMQGHHIQPNDISETLSCAIRGETMP